MSEEPKEEKNLSWATNTIYTLVGMLLASVIGLVTISSGKIDRSQANDMIKIALSPVIEFQKETRSHWEEDSVWKERLIEKKFKIVAQ